MLYTHCYGHALNLSVKDACCKVDVLKETFEMAREIVKLVKDSPQRDMKLADLQTKGQNKCKSIHAFCPTRWTVRGETLRSIVSNYDELLELWEWSLERLSDTEMKARIRGAAAVMERFSFFFGLRLGDSILCHTDNLSRVLQSPILSAVEGQELASTVVEVIKQGRQEEEFEKFWSSTLEEKKKHLLIKEPSLARKRKAPSRFDEGEHYFHTEPKMQYRQHYFEVVDHTTSGIQERFNQPDYKVYQMMQSVILKSVKKEEFETELEGLRTMYEEDFDFYLIKPQLQILPTILTNGSETSFTSVVELLKKLSVSKKKLLSEVIKLTKLILVAPATNAISERSFSTLKRLKTCLRSTMTNNRLNHLMLLHVYQDEVDCLDMKQITNDFVSRKESRIINFGLFSVL